MKTLFALAFLVCISVAYGMKCYTCANSESMTDCTGKETTCTPGFDRCSYVTITYGSTKSFAKGCQTKAICQNPDTFLKAVCKDAGGDCKLEYCDADLCNGGNEDICNGGTAPLVSVLLMVTCALVAFFR